MMTASRQQTGQAMVEFTIIASALLMLILGTLQFALIYHAKITLNYAAFETARAGSLNNARMWAMELGFARAMAPLYTTPYVQSNCGIGSHFGADRIVVTAAGDRIDPRTDAQAAADQSRTLDLNLDQIKCARQRVRDMIADKLVRITLVNPSEVSFADHGPGGRIPSDNLMYRSAAPGPTSEQSVQDATLIKVHIGFCYELIVPFVNHLIWRMAATAPNALQPENFGPPRAGSFAASCVSARDDGEVRLGVPIYSQAIMRMQSDPILDHFCGGDCAGDST